MTAEKVDCVVIPKPEEVFEQYEIPLMTTKMRDHTRHLKSVMEAKFKHLPRHTNLFYDQ